MGDGLQFLDIILFAVIAAFLVLRLRNVLGRRDGHEGGHKDPFGNRSEQENAEDNVVRLPDNSAPGRKEGQEDQNLAGWPEDKADASPADTLASGLARIKAADPAFDAEEFLSGSRMAFDLILGAYAAGESRTLKPLLSPEVFSNFSQAIRSREQAGETMDDTLIGIKKADVAEAYMEDQTALVTVKFISEQIKVFRDENGDVIDGDPSAIAEVTDFWTFARDTRSRDPNWTLIATRSLE